MDNLKEYIVADFERTNGKGTFSVSKMFKALLLESSFKYMFWLRLTRYFWLKGNRYKIPFAISYLMRSHYTNKYGFDFSYKIPIGKGISIAHVSGVIVYAKSVGDNCFFKPGVLIGESRPGSGKPTIGSNVYFGAGAKIIGDISIGNNVIIGANAVVTHDVPDNSVVAGIPARVIRHCESIWD